MVIFYVVHLLNFTKKLKNMKHTKPLFGLLALALFSALLFTACNNKPAGGGEVSKADSTAVKVAAPFVSAPTPLLISNIALLSFAFKSDDSSVTINYNGSQYSYDSPSSGKRQWFFYKNGANLYFVDQASAVSGSSTDNFKLDGIMSFHIKDSLNNYILIGNGDLRPNGSKITEWNISGNTNTSPSNYTVITIGNKTLTEAYSN